MMETSGASSDLQSSVGEEMSDHPDPPPVIGLESDITDEGQMAEVESDTGDFISDDEDTSLTGSEEQQKMAELPSNISLKHSRQEQLRMIALRRHLDQLSERVLECDFLVQRTREELKKCRDKLESLNRDLSVVCAELKKAESSSNTANEMRLTMKHSTLSQELAAEEELEKRIMENLDDAELQLAQAHLEQGKFLLVGEELVLEEQKLDWEREELAKERVKKEQMAALLAERKRRIRDREHMAAVRERERKQRQSMAAARRSREQASRYLKETLAKVRQKEAEEEDQCRVEMQQRMNTILSLKTNIDASRENIRALQARDTALAKQEDELEQEERRVIEEGGGNHDEELIRIKRLRQARREVEEFDSQEKDKQVDIVSRILKEEKLMKKRYAQQPQLFTDTPRGRVKRVTRPKKKTRVIKSASGSSSYEYGADIEEAGNTYLSAVSSDGEFSPFGVTHRDEQHDPDSDDEPTEDLAHPEFEGLWAHQSSPSSLKLMPVESGEHKYTLNYKTKLEQEIMTEALNKHRTGIVRKQVAAGREFTGASAFYSKPDIIHFKDFDIGKVYKKKVILTNVSYTVNFCKLTGLSEHLKDFIELSFNPPGQMSAGLACELLVTFKPMINEDLSGTVQFLAQTGPFAIQVKCTTKKCDLSVDNALVDFGTQVIGETLRKTITLTNNGALSTQLTFNKLTGRKQMTETLTESSIGGVVESTDASDDIGDDNHPNVENSATERDESQLASVDLLELDGTRTGVVSSAEIGAFCSVKLEVIFSPTLPGGVESFFEICFTDSASDPIDVRVIANAIDVPVWVERQNVDLKICMFDRLYQDSIVVNNRATTALRLKFEVCKELRNHLELLPKTGYIQAQAPFTAQLKFLPRHSFFEEGRPYFDPETGVLEAPMTIRVADQTSPVNFTVHAVVTSSELVFDKTDIDFGFCSIYENVHTTVTLTNKSLLAQQFGFLGLPDTVEIQPNDGFGVLLPQETIELDVIFKAKKARDYMFDLTCKSGINREFKISCHAVGVHSPVELSHSVIQFAATAIDDCSYASFYVINSHTSRNEYTHPVPRVGRDQIAPVGPTSYEFFVPDDAPITLYPAVGAVMPGTKQNISVKFSPNLTDNEIRVETVRMVTVTLQEEADREHEQVLAQAAVKQAEDEKKGKKKVATPKAQVRGSAKGKKIYEEEGLVDEQRPRVVTPPPLESIDPDSDEYMAARSNLIRKFNGTFQLFTVPCIIASGTSVEPGKLSYSIHNTLYMEVHCPVVQPDLVIISNQGRALTQYGDVCIGQYVTKSITVQNISKRNQSLETSILNTLGPFQLLNATRDLVPGGTHTMLVGFAPNAGKIYYETLSLTCATSTVSIELTGRGVSPVINLSVDHGVFHCGHVLVGDSLSTSLKIDNLSSLDVSYAIKLESQSLQHSTGCLVVTGKARDRLSLIGPQNLSGQPVFDCVPASGTIPAKGQCDVTVAFSPDHTSNYFSDGALIELFGKESEVICIKGLAHTHTMYVSGGDELTAPVESLAITPQIENIIIEDVPSSYPVLLTFRSLTVDNKYQPTTRELYIGSVKSSQPVQKKGGEFLFENVQAVTGKGFSLDQVKASVDSGTEKALLITWTPPPTHDPRVTVDASLILIVKSETTERYNLMLRALIVTEPASM